MKIKFTKFPTTVGTIKISLDGGQSFTEHNIADIYESGIPLGAGQNYEKIQIQGPSNVLKNLDVLSKVYVGDNEGSNNGDGNGIGFLCFYDGSTPVVELHDGDVSIIPTKHGFSYKIIMSNNYLNGLYKTLFPDSEYNGVVSIIANEDVGYVPIYQTTNKEYNLFTSYTEDSKVLLRFYSDFTQNRTEKDIYVSLKDGLVVSVPTPSENEADEPISEQVLPQYRAVKNYYITKRNTDNYKTDNTSEKLINGWYVPQIEDEHIRYQFIGTDSINNLGIFAVVAVAEYFINEQGKAEAIMNAEVSDVVSNEIDYETGFYIPVSEQTEDSSYVAIFNDLETTWYVAYENNHMEEDGKCEDGYRMVEYNGKKYAVPESLYNCESIAPFPVCELENGLLFVVRAAQGYVIREDTAKAEEILKMDENAVAPHKINYITGYWKLP